MCLLACMDHVGFSEYQYLYSTSIWWQGSELRPSRHEEIPLIQHPQNGSEFTKSSCPKKWPIDFQPEESSVIKKRFSFCAYASACFCFRFIIYLGIARELAVMNECIGHRYMSTMCTMCFWTTLAPPQQKKPNDIGEGGSNLPSFNHLFHTHLQVSLLQKQRNNKKHGLFHGDGLSIHLPPPIIMKRGLR